jgi:hypothetical protein
MVFEYIKIYLQKLREPQLLWLLLYIQGLIKQKQIKPLPIRCVDKCNALIKCDGFRREQGIVYNDDLTGEPKPYCTFEYNGYCGADLEDFND